MVWKSSRPWYRWHWGSYLAVSVVVGALIWRQFEKAPMLGVGDLGVFSQWFDLGWPFAHLEMVETRGLPSGTEFDYEWHAVKLVGNCLFAALLVGSTAFVVETLIRRRPRAQFGTRHLLIVTAILGVLLALSREWEIQYRDWTVWNYWSLVRWSDVTQPIHWPILLAIACAIYTLCWSALMSLRFAYSAVAGVRRQA
jgi:hypothetical protein